MAVSFLPCLLCWLITIIIIFVAIFVIGVVIYQWYSAIKSYPSVMADKAKTAKEDAQAQLILLNQATSGSDVLNSGGKYPSFPNGDSSQAAAKNIVAQKEAEFVFIPDRMDAYSATYPMRVESAAVTRSYYQRMKEALGASSLGETLENMIANNSNGSGGASYFVAPPPMASASISRRRRGFRGGLFISGSDYMFVLILSMLFASFASGESLFFTNSQIYDGNVIDIHRVRGQVPCNVSATNPIRKNGIYCRPDDQYLHELYGTARLGFLKNTEYVKKWYVLPFNRLDENLAPDRCAPEGLIKECLLVSGGRLKINITFGSFRFAHALYESPSTEFPYDYELLTRQSYNPDDTACVLHGEAQAGLYSDTSSCYAASCDCDSTGAYNVTELYPLNPSCAIFNTKHLYPRPTTFLSVTIEDTFSGLSDTLLIPDIETGIVYKSERNRFDFEATSFYVPDFPNKQFPFRLDGGAVICDWRRRLETGFFATPADLDSDGDSDSDSDSDSDIDSDSSGSRFLPVETTVFNRTIFRQVINPHLEPMNNGWYYIDAATISREYRNRQCGQNGISSQLLYDFASPPYCCDPSPDAANATYQEGACIPLRTPRYMIEQRPEDAYPPLYSNDTTTWWVSHSGAGQIRLYREVGALELPLAPSAYTPNINAGHAAPNPIIDFRIRVSDILALHKYDGKPRIVPSGFFQSTNCGYFANLGYGTVGFEFCNSALHERIPAGAQVSITCSGPLSGRSYSIPPTTSGIMRYTIRNSIDIGHCAIGDAYFSLQNVEAALNGSNIDFFDLDCVFDVEIPHRNKRRVTDRFGGGEEIKIKVGAATLGKCALRYLNNTGIINITDDTCKNELDVSCLISRNQVGTTGNPWGIVLISISAFVGVCFLIGMIVAIAMLQKKQKEMDQYRKNIIVNTGESGGVLMSNQVAAAPGNNNAAVMEEMLFTAAE